VARKRKKPQEAGWERKFEPARFAGGAKLLLSRQPSIRPLSGARQTMRAWCGCVGGCVFSSTRPDASKGGSYPLSHLYGGPSGSCRLDPAWTRPCRGPKAVKSLSRERSAGNPHGLRSMRGDCGNRSLWLRPLRHRQTKGGRKTDMPKPTRHPRHIPTLYRFLSSPLGYHEWQAEQKQIALNRSPPLSPGRRRPGPAPTEAHR